MFDLTGTVAFLLLLYTFFIRKNGHWQNIFADKQKFQTTRVWPPKQKLVLIGTFRLQKVYKHIFMSNAFAFKKITSVSRDYRAMHAQNVCAITIGGTILKMV